MFERFLHWLVSPANQGAVVWMNLLPAIGIMASAITAIYVMLSTRRFQEQQARRSFGESIIPSLAFIEEDNLTLAVVNVGKGPAINIRFDTRLESVQEDGSIESKSVWKARTIPPIPVGGRYIISKAFDSPIMNYYKATYSNLFNDRRYQTIYKGLTRENTFKDLGNRHDGRKTTSD